LFTLLCRITGAYVSRMKMKPAMVQQPEIIAKIQNTQRHPIDWAK
jgi:hypothetical protein